MGVEWRNVRKTPEVAAALRGEGREAAVPSRSSAGAIHGLQRPLLAPGSRRKAARLGETFLVLPLLIFNFLERKGSIWAMGKQNCAQ